VPHTSLDQSIIKQLENVINSEITDIFQQISQLIATTYIDVNSDLAQIDFELLDQQILDKFNINRAVLEQLCQTPKFKDKAIEYLQFCFKQVKRICKEKNQQWQKDYPCYAESYQIKLPDWIVYTPKRLDNIFSGHKLQQGTMLAKVKEKFYVNWADYLAQQTQGILLESTVKEQQKLVNTLFECMCISLIFDQGCIQSERLLAIHDAIFNMNLASGLLPMYSNYQNAYVFSYTLPSTKYGNIYRQHGEEETELWQTQHIYFNAFVMLCYRRIQQLLNGPQAYILQNTSPLQCWEKEYSEAKTLIQPDVLLLEKLKMHFDNVLNLKKQDTGEENASEKSPEDVRSERLNHHVKLFLKGLEKTGFAIFKHMDYVLWQEIPDLDVLSTSVLSNQIITSPLIYEQHTQLYDQPDHWKTIQTRIKNLGKNNQVLELEMPTVTVKTFHDRRTGQRHELKSWLLSFHQDIKPKQLADQLQESIQKSEDYKSAYEAGNGEYLDYVVAIAHLRVCQWLKTEFAYQEKTGKRVIEVSTIKRYYGSFVLDLLRYVLEQQINLETTTEDQFEEMYRYIVEKKLLNDQKKHKTTAKTNNNKKHNTSGYAFDRLKAFHQYLVKKHRAPIVQYLYERQSDGLFLKTRLISPQMFQLMIRILREYPEALGLTEQDATCLKWVYILAFRLGLRIDEAVGICIDDFVSPQLRKHPDNRQLYYVFEAALDQHKDDRSDQKMTKTTGDIDDLTLRIRLNSERGLKSDNATRQFDLAYFLAPDEFTGFCRFYQNLLPGSKAAAAVCKRKTKQLFMLGEQPLSSTNLSKITQQLFNAVLGTNDHQYTFHAFRHSAASHLAILLKGSIALVRCFTDYDSEFGRELKKHILPNIKDASSRSAQAWSRLAHLMGHEDIRITTRHYLHHLNILIADMFYQANREYSPQLIKALLSDSQLMRRGFKIEFQSNERDILKEMKKFHPPTENDLQPDPLKNKPKQKPPQQQDVFLYRETFLDDYRKWREGNEQAMIDAELLKLIQSISQPYSIYTKRVKNEGNSEDHVGSTWNQMVKWSDHYQIDQPFRLNKNISRKDLKHFFYCLEKKISLAKDRPVLTFKASCKNDLDDYNKFMECIAKIYPEYALYLEWNQPDLNDFNYIKLGEMKIKKYEIRNKKIAKDNHFIQNMLLQSVFYKMKECREHQKRVFNGSIRG
jgi:integrase